VANIDNCFIKSNVDFPADEACSRKLSEFRYDPIPTHAECCTRGACAPQITEQILCKRGWDCNFLLVKLHTQGG